MKQREGMGMLQLCWHGAVLHGRLSNNRRYGTPSADCSALSLSLVELKQINPTQKIHNMSNKCSNL